MFQFHAAISVLLRIVVFTFLLLCLCLRFLSGSPRTCCRCEVRFEFPESALKSQRHKSYKAAANGPQREKPRDDGPGSTPGQPDVIPTVVKCVPFTSFGVCTTERGWAHVSGQLSTFVQLSKELHKFLQLLYEQSLSALRLRR